MFAVLSARVKAFWARVRQGVTILSDRPRYLREVASLQVLAWLCRFAAFWFLLDAFGVGGSVQNVLLVFGVNQVAGAVPFAPGGAGVQQALLVKVFAGSAPTAVVAAYSVGQQIAIAAFTATVGLASVVFIFRFRSFKEVISAGRASREAEREGRAEDDEPQPRDSAPRAPAAGGGASPGALLTPERARALRQRARALRQTRLLQPRARLAHERHGLGEDERHDGADLFGLRLGAALQVDALDRRDRHVDGELDRVVGPGQFLLALHLIGELREAPLQLLRVSEQVSETATLHALIID